MTDKYDRLLHAWTQERENKILQDLPDHFLIEMKDYINVTDIVEEGNNIQVRISQQEIDRAKMMLKNLVNLRLEKIVTAEIQDIPITTSYMTTDEQHLHANLRQLLSDYALKTQILHLRTESTPIKKQTISKLVDMKRETNHIVLRFLKPLPAIMGTDLKAYGPFKPEDVASVPYENALNLIRRGIAKEVEIDP